MSFTKLDLLKARNSATRIKRNLYIVAVIHPKGKPRVEVIGYATVRGKANSQLREFMTDYPGNVIGVVL